MKRKTIYTFAAILYIPALLLIMLPGFLGASMPENLQIRYLLIGGAFVVVYSIVLAMLFTEPKAVKGTSFRDAFGFMFFFFSVFSPMALLMFWSPLPCDGPSSVCGGAIDAEVFGRLIFAEPLILITVIFYAVFVYLNRKISKSNL